MAQVGYEATSMSVLAYNKTSEIYQKSRYELGQSAFSIFERLPGRFNLVLSQDYEDMTLGDPDPYKYQFYFPWNGPGGVYDHSEYGFIQNGYGTAYASPTNEFENVKITSNGLEIIAKKEASSFTRPGTFGGTPTRGNTNSWEYTTGYLIVKSQYAIAYGYWEVEARMASALACWSAPLWLLHDSGWPASPDFDKIEIDMPEVYANNPTTAYFAYHYEDGDNRPSVGGEFTGPDFTDGYHKFGILRTPDYISYYVDYVERWRVNQNLKQHYNEALYPVISLQMDPVAGVVDDDQLPSSMIVKNLQIWELV